MAEKFRLDHKIDFQDTCTFYTTLKCINIIIDNTAPSIILRSICMMI